MVVLVLVAATNARPPERAAIVSAAREAAGSTVEIVMRAPEQLPSDDEALTLAASLQADAIIEAEWQGGADGTRAFVRMHPMAQIGWTRRELIFRPSDAFRERDRTIGFVIASMLPEAAAVEPPRAAPSPSSERFEPIPLQVPSSANTTPILPMANSPPTPSDPNEMRDPRAPEAAPLRRAIDATGLAILPIGGYGNRFGGTLRLRWLPQRLFSAHLATSVRSGSVDPAQASLFAWLAAVGAGWMPLPETGHGTSIGLRVEGGAKYLTTSHFSADDAVPDVVGRWLPFASVAWEAGYSLQPAASLIAAVAGELDFGKTDIYSHRQWVARLTPIAMTGELGVRARF